MSVLWLVIGWCAICVLGPPVAVVCCLAPSWLRRRAAATDQADASWCAR